MSTGPVPGNGIAIVIPQGMVVFWSALVQAAFSQFVQIQDSNRNVIFTATGGSPDGHSPTQIGQGFFQAGDPSGNYTVWLGINDGSPWSNVIWSQDAIANGGTSYLTKYVFGTEDGSDNDYNDTYLQLQWFQFLG
jgi:mannose-binding lectin